MELDPRILKLAGYMSPDELLWLLNAAEAVPEGGVIVEVGSFCGRSTAALCQGAGYRKIVVAVDPFDDEAMAARPDWHVDIVKMLLEFKNNMAALACFPAVLRMDSITAASLMPDHHIDLLFLDGDHSAIAADLDAWGSKIKQGGVLSGHDWALGGYPIKQEVLARYPTAKCVARSIWRVLL